MRLIFINQLHIKFYINIYQIFIKFVFRKIYLHALSKIKIMCIYVCIIIINNHDYMCL